MNKEWTYASCEVGEFVHETYESKQEAIEAGEEMYGGMFFIGQVHESETGPIITNVKTITPDHSKQNMILDYQDVASFVEHARDEALSDGQSLTTIEELLEYLVDNPEGYIEVIKRKR